MQALILLANVVSYALDSVPLVRYCQRVWQPHFRLNDWRPRAIGTYALISLPSFLFGVVAALVVGNLLALLAFVSALSVPWVTQILPALFYYRWRTRLSSLSSMGRNIHYGHPPWLSLPPSRGVGGGGGGGGSRRRKKTLLLPQDGGEYAPLSRWEKGLVGVVGGVGVCNFLVCAAAAVGKVSVAELRGHTQIGCGKWIVYSG